jgi:hypothetical protein
MRPGIAVVYVKIACTADGVSGTSRVGASAICIVIVVDAKGDIVGFNTWYFQVGDLIRHHGFEGVISGINISDPSEPNTHFVEGDEIP